MDRTVLLAVVLAFAVVLVALMALGWRNRKRRQSDIGAPPSRPTDPGIVVGSFAGKYVSTTAADDPLDRIAVHGLGFRGVAVVDVFANGALLRIVGAQEVWIAREAIRDIRRASWTIDRAVETDGLHLVAWTLGDRTVDSYLRMDDPTEFETALTSITERQGS